MLKVNAGSDTRFAAVSRILLPGLVFQSVIVGGGYGTGREIAEFFLGHGPVGGLLGMLVACLVWGLVLSVAFEFARITKSYNYRDFFQQLLGRFWSLFEVIYLLIALLVLAVLGAGAGEMASSALGVSNDVGALTLMLAVSALVYFGSKAIERVLAMWSVLLYLVYAFFLIWIVSAFGQDIGHQLGAGEVTGNWTLDGVRYAAYNLNALAAVLFVLPALKTRKQAIGSGFLAGVIGIVPGIFVFIAMLAQYPQITQMPVPVTSLLQSLNALWFMLIFQIVLFGTFIETGTGIIHSINERIASVLAEKQQAFNPNRRLLLAVCILLVAVFLAGKVGIINLIASGYGLLSYGFIVVVLLPLLTYGVWRIIRYRGDEAE
ncbi:hypothetical protein [Neptunicella marina]|uniref:Membrane protein YkvI n=1 Tax=Neptunicella marina TaxID=2125989 RepID=A0A8J6IRT9_9ALTE|nr:hypothetical protein [Neptunicella marina]MBC3765616.1 hypothetical protein [Neptunicella marina]